MDLKGLGLQPLRINLDDDIVQTFIAKEGDYKSRGIDLQILKQNKEVDTTGLIVEFYALPADGNVYMITAEEKDSSVGKYEIIYPNSILQPGIVRCELRIINNERIISTKQFKLRVYKSMINEEIFEGVDVEPILAILTEAVRKEKERIANEIERKENEAVRIKNEIERNTAEEERASEEENRLQQEIDRIKEEDKRKNNEDIRVIREEDRVINELTRIESEQERTANENSRLSGERLRVSYEKERQENEKERQKGYNIVQGWIDNPDQFNGKSLQYKWDGTKLGIRLEGELFYSYVDLQGPEGDNDSFQITYLGSDNFNDVNESGVYFLFDRQNSPTNNSDDYILQHYRFDSNRSIQIALNISHQQDTEDKFWFRNKIHTSGWSSWKLISSGGGQLPDNIVNSINGKTGEVTLGGKDIKTDTGSTVENEIITLRKQLDEMSKKLDQVDDNSFSRPELKGIIVQWSGSYSDIPEGWYLCNGYNNTPDLTDKFIMGASSTNIGVSGGSNSTYISESNLPSHRHSFTTSSDGAHGHNGRSKAFGMTESPNGWQVLRLVRSSDSYDQTGTITHTYSGNHTHSGNTDYTGKGIPLDTTPKYYKLAFIMFGG